jgi:thiol-disulfide isomerase/thioredoxin
MKKSILLTFAFLLFGNFTFAQNNNVRKYLNKKAPKLVFGEWISAQPEPKGKFILIDFWATTCSPCRANIPELNSFQEQFKDDLVVIGLSYEKPEKIKKMKTPVIKYSVCTDIHYDTLREMKLRNIPYVILIDPEGYVRWEGVPIYIHHKLTAKVIQDIINKYKKK